ncbi:MAG: hypothetical protein E7062_08805 [Spirochaetaceae bacterium]|nr:hypothetical protein [Spirochaetaceae bacterium]
MKKLLFVFLTLVAFTLVGCDFLGDMENYYSDKWYQYDPEKISELKIPIGASDNSADDKTTNFIDIAEFYAFYNKTDGLRIIIAQSPENSGDSKPIYGEKKYTAEEFSTARWISLVELGNLKPLETEPVVVSNHAFYRDFSSIINGEGIQWKRILADILIDKLLAE